MSEQKTCKQCDQSFIIEEEDLEFYNKISPTFNGEKYQIPVPTLCPNCRQQRRLSFRNERNLYNRKCDLTGKQIISIYSPDKPYKVCDQEAWWSDKWDPKSYGKDFDFSRPFFEQFVEFRLKVPALALFNDNNIGSENCEYTQDFAYGKNCYMCMVAWKMQDCMYLCYGADTKDTVDSMGIWGTGEGLYETMYSGKCFGCRNVYYSSALINCSFCYDCSGCEFCFLCVNLRNKKYCIKNVQYSEKEYFKLRKGIMEDMNKNPYIDSKRRIYKYGEFFPPEFSNFFYNKSGVMYFFPKAEEQALAEGYNWSNKEDMVYNITKPVDSLPDKILDTNDDILNEVIGCKNCSKGYKIVHGELNLLRKMNLPIPHECPKCRENKRFDKMTKPKLYNRNCMKCKANIYTPYAPDRSEIVYCVKCYQGEFL